MYKINEKVRLLSMGVATIKEKSMLDFGDGEKEYYKIVQENSLNVATAAQHYIPAEKLKKLVRKLMTKKEATELMDLLKGKGKIKTKLGMDDAKSVIENGDAKEMAMVLRKVYEIDEPIKKQVSKTISALENLLFDEISTVLKMEREEVKNQVRENYPAVIEYFAKE